LENYDIVIVVILPSPVVEDVIDTNISISNIDRILNIIFKNRYGRGTQSGIFTGIFIYHIISHDTYLVIQKQFLIEFN